MSRRARSTAPNPVGTLLDSIASWIADLDALAPALSAQSPAIIRRTLDVTARLRSAVAAVESVIDPVQQPDAVFNPAEPLALAQAITGMLLRRPLMPLATVTAQYGSGIYALYYHGDFLAYHAIAGDQYPIYVGKAEPAVFDAVSPREQGPALNTRLNDHRKSIRRVELFANNAGIPPSLRVEDFRCRALVLDSAWQGIAENLLIRTYRPVWNKETGVCFGFGKHGDSPEVRGNRRSAWDTLHPGRAWATREGNVAGLRTVEEIVARIREHCAHYRDGQWQRELTPA